LGSNIREQSGQNGCCSATRRVNGGKAATLLFVLDGNFLQSGKNYGILTLREKQSGVELLPLSDPRREVIPEEVLCNRIYSN